MNDDKLLPVGSVIVRRFDDELRKLMIIAHNVKTSNGKTYEYAACGYPEGMIGQKLFIFDHWRIGKVLHKNEL